MLDAKGNVQQSPSVQPAPAMAHGEQPQVRPDRVMQYAWGYTATLVIDAAVQNGLFDALARGPLTKPELVRATGASERGVRMLADALVGLELLHREGDRYALAPDTAAFLVSGRPGFHGGLFRVITHSMLPNWMHLAEVVRTGKSETTLNDEQAGTAFFSQLVENIFPMSYPAARALGEHLGVAGAKRPVSVLDIGAGSGVWGIALAQQSPQVHVRAVDWPRMLEITKRVAARHGVGDRLTGAPGDMLEADFGRGHDIATIGLILHSEGEDRSRRLLRRVFDALAPGGTIAIAEFLPNDDRTGPPQPLLFALNMLVHTDDGDTFTFPEIRGWLEETGFVDAHLLDVPAPSPLILARKP